VQASCLLRAWSFSKSLLRVLQPRIRTNFTARRHSHDYIIATLFPPSLCHARNQAFDIQYTSSRGMNFSFSVCPVVFCVAYTNLNLTEIGLNTTKTSFNQTLFSESCGPANTLSAGNAFWLVFVLAIACVVQLPGSVFLFGRSNFYRFSPELGIADALATAALIVRALWRGYRWTESVVAVFVVREGIGRGDLWWRENLPEFAQTVTATGAYSFWCKADYIRRTKTRSFTLARRNRVRQYF